MCIYSKLAAGAALLFATSAQAVELPSWDIASICTSNNSSGQCRLFESQAKRTLLGGWDVLPETYRTACLKLVKEPDVSYRTLSQCLENQVLKGQQLRVIGTAATVPFERTDRSEGRVKQEPADAGTDPEIETLEDYFKRRESWGTGKDSNLVVRSVRVAAVTSAPMASGHLSRIVSDATPTIVRVAGNNPAPELTEIPSEELDARLKELLAERESWGTEPSMKSAESGDSTEASADASEAEPTDLAGYLARRESWGTGDPPKEVKAPLAAGAVTPLPSAPASAQTADGPAPIIHEREETPAPQLTEVPQSEIESALSDLLAERESWGTEPSATATAEPSSSEADANGALAELLAERESRGTEPSATSAEQNPAVADAIDQAASASSSNEASQDDVEQALSELLAERESWGTAPAASGTQVAARSTDATACESELRDAIGKGTILFQSGSAVLDRASYSTLDELSKRAKGCRNASIYVEGHTDNVGPDTINQRLSEQRAMAVLNYLVEGGVDASRIEAIGFGKSRPLVPNTTAENRAKNRRIEFSVR